MFVSPSLRIFILLRVGPIVVRPSSCHHSPPSNIPPHNAGGLEWLKLVTPENSAIRRSLPHDRRDLRHRHRGPRAMQELRSRTGERIFLSYYRQKPGSIGLWMARVSDLDARGRTRDTNRLRSVVRTPPLSMRCAWRRETREREHALLVVCNPLFRSFVFLP